MKRWTFVARFGRVVGGVLIIMDGGSRMTIDPRIAAMPGGGVYSLSRMAVVV